MGADLAIFFLPQRMRDALVYFLYPSALRRLESEGDSVTAKEAYLLARQDSWRFSRSLVLLERMVLDHLQKYYKEALEKVLD